MRMSGSTVACLATYPARREHLSRVLDSLIGQVDRIYVYLNEYEAVPEELTGDKITAILGACEAGNLSANGKVFPLDYLDDCYVFSCDDDFIYPPDYVSTMKSVIDRFERRVAVAVHGSIFSPDTSYYFDRSAVYDWRTPLPEHKVVTLIGSGTFAFHQSTLPLRFLDFLPEVMVDLRYSIEAKNRGVPLLAVARPAGWILSLDLEGIFHRFNWEITHHTWELQKHGPWSFPVFAQIVANMLSSLCGDTSVAAAAQLNLDRTFVSAAKSGPSPGSWSQTQLSMSHRRMLFKALDRRYTRKNRLDFLR